jgi:NAD(P)-dependent dehydrogenase (short-subunit alcohol dehydrogenase family)
VKKTVLITGASSGIGHASAKLFADKDWNVIATMRNPAASTELACMDNVSLVQLDVRNPQDISRTIENAIARFGKIDVLINNAGFSLSGPFEGLQREKIQEQFEVNVFGVMDATRAILPHFRKNQAGMIINISSRAGLVGLPMMSLYSASKFALEGFSEALAYELAAQNIIVKIVEPSGGVSNTNFGKRLGEEGAHNTSIADYDQFVADTNAAYARMRSKRMASSDEVAQVVYGAATDGTRQLRYFTGEDSGGFAQARRELSGQAFIDFMRSRFAQ